MGSQRTISKYNLEYFHEDLYGKNGRRLAHIGVNGAPHKINGEAVLPHIHMGYFHTEYGGSRKLNDYESGLVAKAQRALYNYRRG